MARPAKFTIDNPQLFSPWRDAVHLGRKFAFVQPALLHTADNESPPSIPYPRVVPLGSDPTEVAPGATAKAERPPSLYQRALVTDRQIYQHDRDVVRALCVDLNARGIDQHVDLANGQGCYERRRVRFNSQGLAVVEYSELPIGDYELRWSCRDDIDVPCEFRVCEFTLAPLVAKLQRHRFSQGRLAATIELTRYGSAVCGDVDIRLRAMGICVDAERIRARDGIAEVTFTMVSAGEHELQLALVEHPNATATVALEGTSQSDRNSTLISQLGKVTAVSLVQHDDATYIRGLYVHSLHRTNSPLVLERVANGAAELTVKADIQSACLVVAPFGRVRQHACETIELKRNLHAGEKLRVPVPNPAALLHAGGFVDDKPWEATAVTLSPAEMNVAITSPNFLDDDQASSTTKQVQPGTTLTLDISIGTDVPATAHVVVRDSRLPRGGSATTCLARHLKSAARTANIRALQAIPANDYQDRHSTSVGGFTQAFSGDMEAVASWMIANGEVTADQVCEAREVASVANMDLLTSMVRIGHVDAAMPYRALASYLNMTFVDLNEVSIPDDIIELMPESVARENRCVPISSDRDTLAICMADPLDIETEEKLRFILNRRIEVMVADLDAIMAAIDEYYGQVEGESADSMLSEFCDTAIDFTETPSPSNVRERSRDTYKDDVNASPPLTLMNRLIECNDGWCQVQIDVPDDCASYTVGVFAASDGDWAETELNVQADRDPYVRMYLPDSLLNDDVAAARVYIRASSGRMSLRVTRDGEDVELWNAGEVADSTSLEIGEGEFFFDAPRGEYNAEVVDLASGRCHQHVAKVGKLGQYAAPRRTLQIVEPGTSLKRPDNVLSWRVLSSPASIGKVLREATANYEHLCCEQTAAKLFAAVASYIDSLRLGEHDAALLKTIESGIDRQRTMWLPNEGFAIYPGRSHDAQWGTMAARHLLRCSHFSEAVETSAAQELVPLMRRIDRLARAAAQVYSIEWPPQKPTSIDDAFVIANTQDHAGTQLAIRFARRTVMPTSQSFSARFSTSQHCYEQSLAAAVLLRIGNAADRSRAFAVANNILASIKPNGRLYSTFDSTALISLLMEVERALPTCEGPSLLINEVRTTMANGVSFDDSVRSIAAINQPLPIEIVTHHTENWSRFAGDVPIELDISPTRGKTQQARVGDTLELAVRLSEGYFAGDILWICLPHALSRITGGGQVKRFAVDFAGKRELTLELAATSPTYHHFDVPRAQQFIVCVRNMFDEERIGSPGPVDVMIRPQ